jgi:effector-binding domain-containing protein
MEYQVQIQKAEPQPIAAVRRRARSDELASVIPAGCGEVWQFIRAANLPNSGLNLAVYFDGEINLECGVIVLAPFQSDGPVICSATPSGMVATAAHFGPYHLLGAANRAITDWCDAQGYKLAGPSWEIYDHWNDDPAKVRTDVFYLLEGSDQAGPLRHS